MRRDAHDTTHGGTPRWPEGNPLRTEERTEVGGEVACLLVAAGNDEQGVPRPPGNCRQHDGPGRAADAQDPDGDPLTYLWTVNPGSLTSPANRQTPWTAPNTPGVVPVTVTVNDGKGGTATASVNITVVQAQTKEYVFEDVHFDFDRYTLRADALRVLDEAITAMQANASLRLQIEGHTCNIGTAEYNLALGERRATAVREYLNSRGINPDRLSIVSYGEERPKFDNSREETRRMNRRAALVVRLQ